ncbi:beta-lactamase domain-containing protein [Trypanosoma conorhini]|uniref:Beta-lactamase domain-containing protein n=1 Tax=Trypanosoma conorhini TaxID=83891 RepID=A0A3R7NY51_9TRYP|nr:beta-lactamase domain-containing protein [Trypanosoma conorhini]RNF25644.1 beta-lactamase domain-containing protein [Trypanosoma conorhini]
MQANENEDAGEEVKPAKCLPLQAAEARHKRSRPNFRPVLLEVAGSLGDTVCQEVTKRLRQYRNRYAPILRLTATLMAPAVQEVELFGPCEAIEGGDGRSTNSKEGVTEEREDGRCEHSRSGTRSDVSMTRKRPREDAIISAPRAAIMAENRIEVVRRLHENNNSMTAVEKLEAFMAYQFLPLALTHNCRPESSITETSFVLRHYVHEVTRTSSFLIADLTERTAAIIDPQFDISAYEADIAALQLQLCGVVLSHCFVDIAMGHASLLARHPEAVLLTGTPWMQGMEMPAEAWPTLPLSPRLQLCCVPVPSFSPECMLVELRFDSTLLALFTGTVFGTDAAPRHDFFAEFPGLLPPTGTTTPPDAAARVAQRFLKERLWDRYFAQSAEGSKGQTPDHVVVFPSHGGYSNVTHQLDLYWAVHLGDLKRMNHSRKVIDNLLDPAAYATYVEGRPPLPKTPLFSHVREHNLLAVPSAFGGSGAKLLSRNCLTYHHLQSSHDALAAAAAMTPIVVDIRGSADHEKAHLKGSVNVPMSFPATAYGAKKAELWLQCLLRPLQPIVVICASEQQAPLVRKRLALISPGAPIETYTAKELEAPSSPPSAVGADTQTKGCITVKPLPIAIPSRYLPRQLLWVTDSDACSFFRIANYQQLQYIEPSEETLVLDCRTSYEFKNGSHKHSIHIPLADLCQITALDTMLPSSPSSSSSTSATRRHETPVVDFCAPSSRLGQTFLEKMYESCTTAGTQCRSLCQGIKKIVVYCASGYRSIIAGSLLRRAFEAAAVSIEVRDVAGGALQIMKQRPDLWTVKDRSIICVS